MNVNDKKPSPPAVTSAPASTAAASTPGVSAGNPMRRVPIAIPPEYLKFHESLAAELRAKRDQVFHLIGSAHWGEIGRHRESVLKQVIQNHLPKNLSLGTGFVIGRAGITRQIDIMIYDNDVPTLFRQDDFLVVPPDGVRAIIEVKSGHRPTDLKDSVKNASINGYKILFGHQDRTFDFFNGVFAFESTSDSGKVYLNAYAKGVQDAIAEIEKVSVVQAGPALLKNYADHSALVNHVCFNDKFFLKWYVTRLRNDDKAELKVFKMGNLSASAFIFSLMMTLWSNASQRARELYFPYQFDPALRALATRTLKSEGGKKRA